MFTVEKKKCNGYGTRSPGVTLAHGQQLQIAYNKYRTTAEIPEGGIRFNVVFAHGTSMNKSVWKYYIEKMYAASGKGWYLDTVVAYDCSTHGDSAVLNEGKIGAVNQWTDNSRDLIAVLHHEQKTTGAFAMGPYSRTIAVGHSFGGFTCLMASVFEPSLFDSLCVIESVFYGDPNFATYFFKRLRKMAGLIMDEFDTLEDVHTYFKQFHFFKNFHPQIMDDFLADEIIEVQRDGETKYATKGTRFNQMTNYFGAPLSIPACMICMAAITVPVLQIVGNQANWNPPEADVYFKKTVPKHLLTSRHFDGEHLINAEKPDVVVGAILEYMEGRVEAARRDLEVNPELVVGDGRRIREQQFELYLEGRIDEVYGYDLDPQYKAKL